MHVEHERHAGGERGLKPRWRLTVHGQRQADPRVRLRFGRVGYEVTVCLNRGIGTPGQQQAVGFAERKDSVGTELAVAGRR